MKKLGLIVFTLTALGWIFRGSIETVFPMIDDTIIAIFFAVTLFIIPTKVKKLKVNYWSGKIP